MIDFFSNHLRSLGGQVAITNGIPLIGDILSSLFTPKQLHKSKIFSLESRKNRLDLFNYAIAPAGKTREYIIDLPLEALRLPSDKVTFLRKLGLKFVRDLIEVPRAALARRLGRDVIDRLNQI